MSISVRPYPACSGMSSDEEFELVVEVEEPRAVHNWRRVVHRAERIRFLRRLWSHLGARLKDFARLPWDCSNGPSGHERELLGLG